MSPPYQCTGGVVPCWHDNAEGARESSPQNVCTNILRKMRKTQSVSYFLFADNCSVHRYYAN
eukprot:3988087-Pleurochrysis_carterae.AAC.1